MTTDHARLTALSLVHATRRNDPETIARTLTDLTSDPERHIAVTTTLATITGSLITGLHTAGLPDLADQLMLTWFDNDTKP